MFSRGMGPTRLSIVVTSTPPMRHYLSRDRVSGLLTVLDGQVRGNIFYVRVAQE